MNDVQKQVEEILHYVAPLNEKWHRIKPWDRHGLILLVAGLVYILVGVTYILSPSAQIGQASANILPNNWAYVGFIIAGSVSIMSSRWPNKPRTLGYATLSGWTAAVAAIYMISGIADGRPGFISQGFVWATMTFVWWAISGLICPPNERGRYGVPSPHRDHCGSFDRRSSSSGHTTVSSESEPNHIS